MITIGMTLYKLVEDRFYKYFKKKQITSKKLDEITKKV